MLGVMGRGLNSPWGRGRPKRLFGIPMGGKKKKIKVDPVLVQLHPIFWSDSFSSGQAVTKKVKNWGREKRVRRASVVKTKVLPIIRGQRTVGIEQRLRKWTSQWLIHSIKKKTPGKTSKLRDESKFESRGKNA